MTEADEQGDLDVAFSLLAGARRRYVLYHLLSESDPADLPALVDAVVEREADASAADAADLRRTVKLSLHHVHLPKLDDAGVVRYDRRAGRVELLDAASVVPFLDDAARVESAERADLDP